MEPTRVFMLMRRGPHPTDWAVLVDFVDEDLIEELPIPVGTSVEDAYSLALTRLMRNLGSRVAVRDPDCYGMFTIYPRGTGPGEEFQG